MPGHKLLPKGALLQSSSLDKRGLLELVVVFTLSGGWLLERCFFLGKKVGFRERTIKNLEI